MELDKNVTKKLRIRNCFFRYNSKYKWFSIEHDWDGIVIEHKWTWGFGDKLRYHRTWLPF